MSEKREVIRMYGFQRLDKQEEALTVFNEIEEKPAKEFDLATCSHKYWKWKWENGRWTDYRICNTCGKVEACFGKSE